MMTNDPLSGVVSSMCGQRRLKSPAVVGRGKSWESVSQTGATGEAPTYGCNTGKLTNRFARKSPAEERGKDIVGTDTAGGGALNKLSRASSLVYGRSQPGLGRSCGYALVNKGHDTRAIEVWLGHRSITSTAVYTALAPNRFKDFRRD
jgi:hypothetical protein